MSVDFERINPEGLAPATGFSHAVRTRGTTVHLAGQTALNAGGRIVSMDIVEQFEQALGNLLAALDAAGGTPDRLASLTIYLTSIDEYKDRAREIGSVWRRLVGSDYPAMAAVGVSELWDLEAKVEVQGVACLE